MELHNLAVYFFQYICTIKCPLKVLVEYKIDMITLQLEVAGIKKSYRPKLPNFVVKQLTLIFVEHIFFIENYYSGYTGRGSIDGFYYVESNAVI